MQVHLDKQGDRLGPSITDESVRDFVLRRGGAMSGAQTAGLINSAATSSARAGRKLIEMSDIEAVRHHTCPEYHKHNAAFCAQQGWLKESRNEWHF